MMNTTNDPGQQGQSLNGLNGHQTQTLVCIWALFAVSSVVMILRLVSQFGLLRVIRADDILMIIAWILQTAKTIVSTFSLYWGLGRHDRELLSPQAFVNVMKSQMISMIVGTLCGLFARVSFAVFLLYFIRRVSRTKTYLVWSLIVLQVVVNVLFLVYDLVRCVPADMKWSPQGVWQAGMCWTSGSELAVQYVQGAINAATNLCLTFLALGLVLQIRAPRYTKVSLGILLSLSLIATIAQIVSTVMVRGSESDGSDFAYRLNTWNYWYAIQDAVIIITASIPKIRPVLLISYQRLKKSRVWKNCTSRGRLNFLPRPHNRNMPAGQIFNPGRRVTGPDDNEESAILHQLNKPNTYSSIYSKDSKPTAYHNSFPAHQSHIEQSYSSSSHKKKHHRRHPSGTSGGTKSSFGLHSLSRFTTTTTTTTTTAGFDSIDLSNFGHRPCSRGLSNDFVPTSPSRLTCQTVISAGDDPPAHPPPRQPSPLPSYLLPQQPPAAVTPTNSLSPPNGSGRSSRNSRRDCGGTTDGGGFTTTNSSMIFLPVNNINPGSSSSARSILSQRNQGNHSAGPFGGILQTNHFSIEYENEDNGNNGIDAGNNSQQRDSGLAWNGHHVQLAETAAGSTNGRYNEDDADALQLHDVGCILDESKINQP